MPKSSTHDLNFRDEQFFTGLMSSLSYAVGVFETSGKNIFANAGMQRILTTKEGEKSIENLINPVWDQLINNSHHDTILYEGIFTFSVGSSSYQSLKGTAQRRAEQILLLIEYDVVELSQVQVELVSLNGEVTNLQREVAIKNSQLAKTLIELKDTQMMLIHSEKMNAMGQLVAGVAHEINNPISFVDSNVHALGRMTRDLVEGFTTLEQQISTADIDSLRTSVAQIRAEIDLDFIVEDLDDLMKTTSDGLRRVKKIVEQLRNFSRLDEAETKRANLREGLESSLSLAQTELKNRISVSLDIVDDLPEIMCRPAELNQVFLNIIINAAQAIHGDGRLSIKVIHDSKFVTLIFSDDGEGMTPDVMKNIFNPFFTTKPVGSGTGLGLSIAHKIITDGHHGTINVESEIGKGSSFVIRLPIDT